MTTSWLTHLLDTGASVLSPRGPRGRLSVLIYHRVLEQPDVMRKGEVDRASFEWHMALLSRHFRVLPLTEACRRLGAGTLPARAAAVTFDDGYADNATVALPILRRHGVPATFFIATAFLDGGRMWNDSVIEWARRVPAGETELEEVGLAPVMVDGGEARRHLAQAVIGAVKYLHPEERERKVASLARRIPVHLPDDLMLTSEQVCELTAAGMEVGAHTHRHPILASLAAAEARQEIEVGKKRLEAITGQPVRVFAYPNGKPGRDYRLEHRELVRSLGFEAAVSTHFGAADRASDPFQLPRFTPWHGDPTRFHMALLRNLLVRAQPEAVAS